MTRYGSAALALGATVLATALTAACGGADPVGSIPSKLPTASLLGTWRVTTTRPAGAAGCDSTTSAPAVTLWIAKSPDDVLDGGELIVDSRWAAGSLAGPLRGGIRQTSGETQLVLYDSAFAHGALLAGVMDTVRGGGVDFTGTLADLPAADSLALFGVGDCRLDAAAVRADTAQRPPS